MLLGAVCVIDTPGFITGFLSFKNFETLPNGKMKVIVIVTYDRESWGKILNMSPSRPMLCSSRAGILMRKPRKWVSACMQEMHLLRWDCSIWMLFLREASPHFHAVVPVDGISLHDGCEC